MSMLLDPQKTETAVLHRFLGDLRGKWVLEVGCGEGRLTRQYAHRAAFVQAIDPDEARIDRARQNTPIELQDRVHFQAVELAAFTATQPFDWVMLSWSL